MNKTPLVFLLLLSLTACSQSNTKKVGAVPAAQSAAVLPLGRYNVYQNSGAGFGYQYKFYILNSHEYKMDNAVGSYTYTPANRAVHFTSGKIKGFSGVLTQVRRNNETGRPMIVMDFQGKGETPDTLRLGSKPTGYYQYAHYHPEEN